jgi:hypothetical protein
VFVIRGEGPFADAVRRTLEYAQSRGIDLSGVEVEVVPDPSIADFGAYTEHRGGLKFRIRYNPRYAGDPMLAAHEAGHVAYWSWAIKTGKTRFFSNPDVIEPLAEAFGAVVARQLYNWPVAFKGAPPNLTKILPERFTYITTTADGRPMVVKVPEWDDYMKRYRAGILLSPYFYNMTNWAHVFGNFTAAPADVIKTVHKAWQSGAVEVVPGWGAVWRREPTWSWPTTDSALTQQRTNDNATSKTNTAAENNTQKSNAPIDAINVPQTTNNATHSNTDRQKTSEVTTTRPLIMWQQNFDVYRVVQEKAWNEYNKILAQTGNHKAAMEAYKTIMASTPPLYVAISKEDADRIVKQFEDLLLELKRLRDEVNLRNVDEVHEKFLQLRDKVLSLARTWPAIVNIDKADQVIRDVGNAISKTRRKLEEALIEAAGGRGVFKKRNVEYKYDPATKTHIVTLTPTASYKFDPDTGAFFLTLHNEPVAENIVGYIKDDGTSIALFRTHNYSEASLVYEKLRQSPPKQMPKSIKEVYKITGVKPFSPVDSAIRKTTGADRVLMSWKEYDPDTGAFMVHAYPSRDGKFLPSGYFIGYLNDDGTAVIVKKVEFVHDAKEEYNKFLERLRSEQTGSRQTAVQQTDGSRQTDLPSPLNLLAKMPVIGPVLQVSMSSGDPKASTSSPSPAVQNHAMQSGQLNFFQPLRGAVDFLANALKAGAGIRLTALGITALGGARPSSGSDLSGGQQFVATTPQSAPRNRAVYNRRRGLPTSDDSPVSSLEFTQPPNRQQRQDEFAVDRPSRPLDIILAEGNGKRNATRLSISQPTSGGSSGSGSEFVQPSGGGSDASRAPSLLGIVLGPAVQHALAQAASSAENRQSSGHVSAPSIASPPDVQTAETSQAQSSSEPRRRLGRPVAVAI